MQYKVTKKAYSFENEYGKTIQGNNYYLEIESPIGTIDLKIVAKGIEKNILELVANEK